MSQYQYLNLENPEIRDFALNDPKAFIASFDTYVILDEIQRVPHLLSYIQVLVDDNNKPGQFVLTGSHQLELRQAISQSLAGRTGLLTLLPLSIHELSTANIHHDTYANYIFNGFLPRIYDQNQRPTTAYSNYYQTYIERDVRQLINLKEASLFEKFIKLLAGRVGQLIDYSSLGNDTGISANTVKHWLSILEASFVIVKLAPYYENFGRRLVKSPKYYFVDTGLLSFLLGIQNAQQVTRDPLMGTLFENLVVMDCLKAQLNQGKMPSLYFYRDSNGLEVDILWQDGRILKPIEVKASATYNASLLKSLKKFKTVVDYEAGYLIYNGEQRNMSDKIHLRYFTTLHDLFNPTL